MFSLLAKWIVEKFNVPIILLVESDRLVCVSVNSLMSLLIILSPLTILSICFESEFTLWRKTASNCLIKYFFIVENYTFCFGHV